MVLATAVVIGDKAAALKHGCSERSIRRWRDSCDEDATLAAAVQCARATLEANWSREIPAAIICAIDYLTRATAALPIDSPDAVEAVTKALDTLSMVIAHDRMLDAHLAGQAPRVSEKPVALVTSKAS